MQRLAVFLIFSFGTSSSVEQRDEHRHVSEVSGVVQHRLVVLVAALQRVAAVVLKIEWKHDSCIKIDNDHRYSIHMQKCDERLVVSELNSPV